MKKLPSSLPIYLIVALLLVAALTACTTTAPVPETGSPDTPEETVSQTLAPPADTDETAPETQPESETAPETETEAETPGETAPDVLPELSATPAEEIVTALAPDARHMVTSTIGKEVILRDRSTVEDIVSAFVADGYYDYPIRSVKGAKFTTHILIGKTSTVAVYFYPDRKEVRIAWEDASKFDHTVLKPKSETDTGTILFAQVGTERVGEKDNPMIGMIHILKLSDGRAVIIDGGTGNERNVENILSTLDKLGITKDENGRYVIAAWLITHAHGDHVGAVTAFMNTQSDKASVETFIYNFTKDAAVIGSTSGNIDPFVAAIDVAYPAARHVVAHAGVKYYFGNLTLSMLYTPELVYDDSTPLAYYNNSSLVFRLSVGDSSMFEIGDAGEEASRVLCASYDLSTFRSRVLQLTHHGLYTESGGHTWTHLRQVYDSVEADMAILPMQSKYAEDARNGRYTVLHDWAKAGHQISYIMDLDDVPALFANRISQALWDEFETKGTLKGKEVATLYGYDGINTVTRADGFVTYLGANRTTPMVVCLELDGKSVTVKENQEFYTWIASEISAA